jgi:hypothetical protein
MIREDRKKEMVARPGKKVRGRNGYSERKGENLIGVLTLKCWIVQKTGKTINNGRVLTGHF